MCGFGFGLCGGVMEGLIYKSIGLYDLKHDVIDNLKNGLSNSLKGGNILSPQAYPPHAPLPNGVGGPVMLP